MYALDCFSRLVLEVLEIGQSLIVHGDECVKKAATRGVNVLFPFIFTWM